MWILVEDLIVDEDGEEMRTPGVESDGVHLCFLMTGKMARGKNKRKKIREKFCEEPWGVLSEIRSRNCRCKVEFLISIANFLEAKEPWGVDHRRVLQVKPY
ncbi:hypothetical protein SK128_022559, partial [Halocaridina rubra]